MEKEFTNEKRSRYYGLRVGDIVKCKAYNINKAEVAAYSFSDNNRVELLLPDGKAISAVAEWCEIITKVEDR